VFVAPREFMMNKIWYRYSNCERGLSRNQLVGGVGIRF
jgi:hypothetical protein